MVMMMMIRILRGGWMGFGWWFVVLRRVWGIVGDIGRMGGWWLDGSWMIVGW